MLSEYFCHIAGFQIFFFFFGGGGVCIYCIPQQALDHHMFFYTVKTQLRSKVHLLVAFRSTYNIYHRFGVVLLREYKSC